MKREIINPWTWQEKYGFVHANRVSGADTLLFVSGQVAVDDNGDCHHPDDMAAQLEQVIHNIETILSQAEMDFTDVVRLVVYTTDMQKMLAAHDHMARLLQERHCQHAGTMVGVNTLSAPGAMVEIEVTAAC